MTLTQIKPAGLSKPVDLADNEQIRLGTGNDLQIYHDGTNSFIKDTAGASFNILATESIAIKTNNTEFAIACNKNGSVELYYDNSGPKLATTSTGVNLGGGTCTFNDNGKLALGTGSDLQIYHDGSHARFYNTTGDIIIRNNGKNALKSIPDAAIELYHNSGKKFETTAYGAKTSGELEIDSGHLRGDSTNGLRLFSDSTATTGITLSTEDDLIPQTNNAQDLGHSSLRYRDIFVANDIDISDNGKVKLGDGDDLQIYHDGTVNRIRSDVLTIIEKTDSEDIATFNPDGGVALFYDGSQRFETESNGATLTGARLKVQNSGNTDFNIRDTSTNAVSAYIGAKTAGRVEYNCYKEGVGTKYPHVFVGYTEEYARIDTNGIKFNGDTAAGNGLDDYEEGTFTPVFSVEAQSGNAATALAIGRYVKIGRTVHIHIEVQLNGTPSGRSTSNAWQWSGFPFNPVQYNSSPAGGIRDYRYPMIAMNVDTSSTYGSNGHFVFRIFDYTTQGRIEWQHSDLSLKNASLFMLDGAVVQFAVTYCTG